MSEERACFDCIFCNIVFSSPDDYYEHFKEHTKEEVEVLKKLALLHIKNPKGYDDLMFELLQMEYNFWQRIEREKRKTTNAA